MNAMNEKHHINDYKSIKCNTVQNNRTKLH
jgi:hypothetical protein